MRTQPPANLVSLLTRLKLATPEQIAGVGRRAARLAGELPDFESVWVDALAQARVLTPFQAAQINAGRAESLVYGPYVVTGTLPGPHWAECYCGRNVEARRTVRIYVARMQRPIAEVVEALAELLAHSNSERPPTSFTVEDFGTSGELAWATCAEADGTTAADWVVENGRLPPAAVLQIAREMVARLAEVEHLGFVHGDIGAAGLLLQESGHIVLPAPGLRGVLRPFEGYGSSELRPEAYDYLAPERIADGTPPTVASDAYACGCLWWQLLTGRVPFAGGNSLAKLKAVNAARLVDVRQLAPDVPDTLARAMELCLARDPADRPKSFDELSERLGPPTRGGNALLASLLARPTATWQVVRQANHRKRRANRSTPWAAGVAAVCVTLFVALIPLWLFARPRGVPTAALERRVPATVEQQPAKPQLASARNVRQPTESNIRIDTAVRPAAATLPAAPRQTDDLVLPTNELLRVEQLDLKPHSRVRGRAGGRPMVRVPARGLLVACEDVTFDDVDFVWQEDRQLARIASGAMIIVRAQTARFQNCTFTTSGDVPPVAIAWSGAAESPPGLGAELTFGDCVFNGTAAVVDSRGSGGLTMTIENSLCADAGPVVLLHRAPKSDSPISLLLERATLRGESAVLECRYRMLGQRVGAIAITANGSVLAGNPDTALVLLAGTQHPAQLVSSLSWTGQGSIVTPRMDVMAWRATERSRQVLEEEDLEVDGLVRSELRFAGPIDGPPAASRVTRWQVPLRSADPPGADSARLPAPRR